MKRTTLWTLATILFLVSASVPLNALATSYMPFFHLQDRSETVMRAGQTIFLFHSGTNDVRTGIRANDILAVYRITPSCEVVEVGKVVVIAYAGETYLKGEVVEGEIKPDDIARKGNISCLVIAAGTCRR